MLTNKTRNDNARCIGVDPMTFDIPECYPDALATCDECTVRLWCLQLVDPANSSHDGVAGGHIWLNGQPEYDPKRAKDPVLLTYLQQATGGHVRHARTNRPHRSADIDEVAINLFIQGNMSYMRLTGPERKEAARIMYRQGTSIAAIAEALHMGTRTIQEAIRQN